MPTKKLIHGGGWWLLVALLIAAVVASSKHPAYGLLVMSLVILYVTKHFHRIKDPDIGLVFLFGHFIGPISAGWYLCLPGIEHVVTIQFEWKRIEIPSDEVYTKDGYYVETRAVTWIKPDIDEIAKVIEMMPTEMAKRALDVGLAALRRAIGKNEFDQIAGAEIENEVSARLTEECQKNGYKIDDFELAPLSSKPARIKADGHARGEAAKAMAEPFKDNFPAALANMAHTFGSTAENIAADFLKPRRSKSNNSESLQLSPEDVGQISAFLKQLQAQGG